MWIVVDYDRCDSTGLCTAIAPDLFSLDDDDLLRVHRATVAAHEAPSVEEAARACPKLAITLRDGD